MILNGNISTFRPENLLTFFADSETEGLLTVTGDEATLNISIKKNFIVHAQSDLSDMKIMNGLIYRRLVDKSQLLLIQNLKKETSMPVWLILEQLALFSMSKIEDMIKDSIKEVLFRLFLMADGKFHLTALPLDKDIQIVNLDSRQMVVEMARNVDEWWKIAADEAPLNHIVQVTQTGKNTKARSIRENMIIGISDGRKTIDQIVRQVPIPSYYVLKAVAGCLKKEWLAFSQKETAASPDTVRVTQKPLMHSFKTTFKKNLQTQEHHHKIAQMVSFCKDHFDQVLMMVIQKDLLSNIFSFTWDSQGSLIKNQLRDIERPLNVDPIFSWVHRTGQAFFSHVFPTSLFKDILALPKDGACALIPLEKKDGHSIMVYAASKKSNTHSEIFHYLELLSQLVRPASSDIQPDFPSHPKTNGIVDEKETKTTQTGSVISDRFVNLVTAIDDLPPLPKVVHQIIQLLSDPDSTVKDLSHLIEQDPPLVIKILKISNSALYNRGYTINNIMEAITRLGMKAIKSLVIAVSVNTIFPKTGTKTGNWAQQLWLHSKACAIASRRIAMLIQHDDPEEAFVGGLLHDIGKLALILKLPKEFERVTTLQAESGIISVQAENRVMGFDHTMIGKVLLKKWKISDKLETCVGFHHTAKDIDAAKPLVRAVYYGNLLANLATPKDDGFQFADKDFKRILQGFYLTDEVVEDFKECLVLEFQQIGSLD